MNNKMRRQDKTPSGRKWHYDFNLLIYRLRQSFVVSFLLFLFVSVAWICSCILYSDFPEVYAAEREDAESRIESRILEDPIFLNALVNIEPENAVPISDKQVKDFQARADVLAKRLQLRLVKESILTAYLEEKTEETSSPKDGILAPELNSASDTSVTDSTEDEATTEPVKTAPEEEQAETTVTLTEATSEEEPVEYFDVPLSESLQSYIYELAEEYDIPAALIIAVIDQESQFDSDSISATNDYGLMQINEINFGWLQEHFGSINFIDPFQNVEAGTYMLSELYHKYPESIHLSLMAYNMGEGGARKQWESGVYSSDYSRSVAELYEFYKG